MKKFLVLVYVLGIFSILSTKLYAYTEDDVALHNTENDCWMTYDGSVYDLTNYINNHDVYLDIRDWCGTDMTEDFETKDGIGRDHKSSSYALLENYKIGDIEETVITYTPSPTVVSTNDESTIEETSNKSTNPYNIWIPLFLTLLVYWISYYMYGRSNLKRFNGFWNTVLLLTLLIPAFGFGIFMILRYSYSVLWNIDFDFMYWHVELSVVMSILGISHLIQRFSIYKLQIQKGKNKGKLIIKPGS